jgi:aspartate dehydrogenase
LRVALIGCGAIGTTLAKAVERGRAGNVELRWIYDIRREKAEALARGLRSKTKIAVDASDIYADKDVELVIEAASQQAVGQYSLDILRSGKDLMVMSVGAFSDEKLLRSVRAEAERCGRRVYIPSGAVLGIDGVKAAELGGIREVILTTRKSPSSLAYGDYIRRHRINLRGLKKPRVIFEGPAREAVKAFPASVNVAATLSLAGVGFDRTRVRIVADPRIKRNVHEIRVRGRAGELVTEARNVPFPESRRTSYLAALSAIRTLRNLSETIRIGT